VALAAQVAENRGETGLAKGLYGKVDKLKRSRLAAEDKLCGEHMTLGRTKMAENPSVPDI
jgi:hypothetical protein